MYTGATRRGRYQCEKRREFNVGKDRRNAVNMKGFKGGFIPDGSRKLKETDGGARHWGDNCKGDGKGEAIR